MEYNLYKMQNSKEKEKEIEEIYNKSLKVFGLPERIYENLKTIKETYDALDIYDTYPKIFLSYLIRLASEPKDEFKNKAKEVSIILNHFQKSVKSFEEIIIKAIEDPLYKKINHILFSFQINELYPYLLWKYLDLFGESAENFIQIFLIILNA